MRLQIGLFNKCIERKVFSTVNSSLNDDNVVDLSFLFYDASDNIDVNPNDNGIHDMENNNDNSRNKRPLVPLKPVMPPPSPVVSSEGGQVEINDSCSSVCSNKSSTTRMRKKDKRKKPCSLCGEVILGCQKDGHVCKSPPVESESIFKVPSSKL